MNKNPFLLFVLLTICAFCRGQRAWPGSLVGLYSKIPVLVDSKSCYDACTRETDASNGVVSIKDNGPVFAALNEQLLKVAGASQASMGVPAVQQPATGASSSGDLAVMRAIGPAQMAAGHISQLIGEMSQKLARLDKSGINGVKQGPNCPEVQQGGYAGPTCACMKEHAVAYAKGRVTAQNLYLSQVQGIVADYLGRMKTEAAVIDNMEEMAKYGDAVSNPTYRQLVVSIQRQAVAGLAALLGVASGNWTDAAKEYAGEVNADSGASVGCHGK